MTNEHKYLEPTPPFNIGDKVLCIKDSQEVQLDNTVPHITALDDNGNETEINVGAVCIANYFYDVDCCLWSPFTGWVVVISGEFHKADCFRDVIEIENKE